LVKRTAWARQIHVVLDNLSAHKTKEVERFLQEHPRVRSLHPDVSVVAEPGRALVRQDPAGRDCARRVHLGGGSGQQAAEIHPRLFQVSQAVPLDLHRSQTTNHC